ncbi:MAG: penicillin-binding transpeptidase domain-containing protein [Hornefia sp.]|nr:penicillin-binding transpeptidase domain-containing protein [Hornefia sp.]
MSDIRKKNKQRMVVAFLIMMFLVLLLAFRMAWIQIVKADEYGEKAKSQQTTDMSVEANRGIIYDRNGKELASSATSYSVWLRPNEVLKNYTAQEKKKEVSEKLALALDMKSEDVLKKIDSKSAIVNLAKYVEKKKSDKVRNLEIAGVEISEGTKRYYPLGSSAAKLLGSVTDDSVGRTGIEAEFDNFLSGISGRWIRETDLNGDTLSNGSQKLYKAKDGYNLYLTIDEVLQNYAESAVKVGMAKTKAKRVMCLVMNPETGDILAMVTNPSFNPNNAMEPESKYEKASFMKMTGTEQGKYLSKMWSNPIVSDLYEPGSTFKLITTSAALEEGVATPKSRFFDSGSINVDGTVLHCWNKAGHGSQSLTEAVGNSCNTVQVNLALKIGKKKYYNYLDMFGITDTTHVDLPAETTAIIKKEAGLTNVDLATMSYGQGIAVTPIQLLTAVSSIGNEGMLMEPRIVKKMTDRNGKTVKKYNTKVVRKVISSKTASEMKGIMEFVVGKGGGGNAKVPGYRIGGKTGTADKVVNGKYTKDTYSSFVGMAPMEDPKLAVLVVVDSPMGTQFGSAVAAPIAQDFLKNALTYMEISPKYASGEDRSVNVKYVPNLKGMTLGKAAYELSKLNLKCKVSPKTERKDYKVVDQYPKAGAQVKRGDTVYIYRE